MKSIHILVAVSALLILSEASHRSKSRIIDVISYGSENCVDQNIWIADGSAKCTALLGPSRWGSMHKKQQKWCNDYSLTKCCATCKKLRKEGKICKKKGEFCRKEYLME